jgi:hypothetical protein
LYPPDPGAQPCKPFSPDCCQRVAKIALQIAKIALQIPKSRQAAQTCIVQQSYDQEIGVNVL